MTSKFCVVLGCKNTEHELKLWRKLLCSIHKTETPTTCGCREPFELFHFPNENKLQKLWLERIGLTELDVSDSTCICSIHFVEGKPTKRSFFPTLYLQTDLSDDENGSISASDPLNSNASLEQHDTKDINLISGSDFSLIKSAYHYEGDDDEQEEAEMEIFSNSPLDNEFRDLQSSDSPNINQEIVPEKSIIPDMSSEDSTSKPAHQTDDDDIQIVYQQPPKVPLARYDPKQQTLQISNPVQYILECHNRIALLVAENQQLKKYETEVLLLKKQNKLLKRKLSQATTTITVNKPGSGRTLKLTGLKPRCRTKKVIQGTIRKLRKTQLDHARQQ